MAYLSQGLRKRDFSESNGKLDFIAWVSVIQQPFLKSFRGFSPARFEF
jgi:hypothetical protein